jgi:hypothetical protein
MSLAYTELIKIGTKRYKFLITEKKKDFNEAIWLLVNINEYIPIYNDSTNIGHVWFGVNLIYFY